MSTVSKLYGKSLALLTDLYQLTMAYGYWKSGTKNKEAVFNLFFRKAPFNSGYSVACGLHYTIDFLRSFHFDQTDIDYLATLKGRDSKPLFEDGFLEYLLELKFSCDIDAMLDGTVVFPNEPMLRVRGPIVECQLLETPLLNIWNFQTLIATKAARIRQATGDDPLLEFGARRAQGIDGALTASYAAHVGGCDATSNVLAGKIFNIPVSGTHAHSWVMCFESELQAFMTYAECMPNNCVFLVDTYDSLEGVKNAIKVGNWLRERNHDLVGIRLDSGDLAYLSIEARKMLDEAGFPNALIMASNDLDENIVDSLKAQGAMVNGWGIGTKLITAFDNPALGCVYKLAAIRTPGDKWQYRIKLSEQQAKISTPGIQQVRRFSNGRNFVGDAVYDEETPPCGDWIIADPLDITRRKTISANTESQDLLVPIFRQGVLSLDDPGIASSKTFVKDQLTRFHPGIKRILNPHQYPVGLELGLSQKRFELILKARGFAPN